MAKKQTRRSVSIRGNTYDRVRSYCEKRGQSMSEFVEDLIGQFFDNDGKVGVPRPVSAVAPPAASADPNEKLSDDELQDAARFFTF